jgi:hypothetical protein
LGPGFVGVGIRFTVFPVLSVRTGSRHRDTDPLKFVNWSVVDIPSTIVVILHLFGGSVGSVLWDIRQPSQASSRDNANIEAARAHAAVLSDIIAMDNFELEALELSPAMCIRRPVEDSLAVLEACWKCPIDLSTDPRTIRTIRTIRRG